jgi:hypothetical protein
LVQQIVQETVPGTTPTGGDHANMNNIEAAILSKRLTDLALLAVCTLIKLHLIPTTFSVQTDGEIEKPEVGTIHTPHTTSTCSGSRRWEKN